MADFFVLDADGNIVKTGSCQESLLDQQGGPGLRVVVGLADGFRQFWSGGGLATYSPEQIEDRYRFRPGFRWSRGQWNDERTLDAAKGDKWREIKAKRDAVERGGFTCGAYRFDSDVKSQNAIALALQGMDVTGAATIDWTTAINEVVTVNVFQLRAIAKAMRVHIQAQRDKATTLRQQIEAATTKEDLAGIQW